MGSSVSQDVYDVLDEDQNQTPLKSSLKTLPKEFDPRSPSQGVDRTPIQYVATPARLLDPRSPTEGIERTPIYPSHGAAGNDVDLLRMDECDLPRVKAVPFDLMEADDSMTMTGSDVLIPVPVPMTKITPSEPLKMDAVQDKTEIDGISVTIATPPDMVYVCVAKPPAKTAGEGQKVKSLPPVPPLWPSSPRSPLGTRNVDSGSLRSMVQLKEARKAESLRNSKSSGDLRLRRVSSCNKENM